MQQSFVTFVAIPLSSVSIHRIDETLPTAFLDSDSTLLEKNEERDRLIGSLCEDYTVWSNVLEESREERGKWNGFKTDMYFYASENLMQVNVYIRYNIFLSKVDDQKKNNI